MHKNHPKNSAEYKKEIEASLNDEFLSTTLSKFAINYKESRDKSFKQVDEKALIAKIADCKDFAAQNVEDLYTQFKIEAEKNNVIVHRVQNSQEANALISKIAKDNNVKSIVKSKSMTSEETELNTHLYEQGFEVEESDLGEWLVQLRNERPSHMVLPIIHLSRHQVAENLSELTGVKQDSDVSNLVKIARRHLRPKFVYADMGITGANFAVAESGSIATVTNEGNARMVTTLPKVHVALLGLDKLIPKIEDALNLLQVLPRNATGQMITSYVNWITGAGESLANEDKKKIMHIIFLDNGRTAIAKDPIFSQVFRCVRCGACANVCPIYRLVGGHKMGYIYIGAIGLVLTYLFHGKDKARLLAQNCINCEACKNICAGSIDLPALINEIRVLLDKEYGSPIEGNLLSALMKNRKVFHTLLKFAKYAQLPSTAGTAYQRHLPNIFLGKHGYKALPALASEAFRDRWPKLQKQIKNPKYRIAIFTGCAQDFIYPEQLVACLDLLYKHNVQVEFPLEQSCCGLPLKMMAQEKTLKVVALQNVNAFAYKEYDAILTLCASCASHLKHNYKAILLNIPEMTKKVDSFCTKIIDFSSFVRDYLNLDADNFNKSDKKVAYHASCHLCRGLGVNKAPRELIDFTSHYIKSEEEENCCGFGGTYSMKFPEISAKILENKLKNISATEANYLAVDCPGCVMQLGGGVEKNKLPIKVIHISELLKEQMK